jgi:predicted permease
LARSSARLRELATRLALGASRFRVTRQLIVEGVILAGVGGIGSVVVGAWLLDTMSSTAVRSMPNGGAVAIDWTVLVFIAAISVMVGAFVGLMPAAALGRLNINYALADGSRLGTGGRSTRLLRRGLVVAQVAFSVVLLIGAGLLLTSFRNLLAVDAGFQAEGVTTATIFPPPSRYKDQVAVAAMCNRLLESIRSLPGVHAAGITSNIPLSGRASPATVSAADYTPQPGEAAVFPSVVGVTPGYFEAMATRLVRGRYFADTDRENTLRVAIVDERLAARLWPNADPIGKGLFRGNSERYTVVGIVRDVRFESLAGQVQSAGAAYFPHTQAPAMGRLRWIAIKADVRTEAAVLVRAVRSAMMQIDPDLPLTDIQTMTERTGRSVGSQRLAMSLATMFGIVALLLSILGVYGVLAYVVTQRTREIGIRIALGSTPRGVFGLVFNEGLLLIGAGLALGLGGALAMGRALEGHMFGVRPADPIVLGAVALSTAFVALLACVAPAHRATRVDAVQVLSDR